jgi:hypothetical protein
VKRAFSLLLVLAMVQPAIAGPHRIVVLQTEGRAEAGLRAKIDATLSRLARSADAQVSPGDITFSDAAAGVGCKPEVAACRDEVLGMLAVDEVIYASTALKPGGIEIEVHRVTRGGMTRDARMVLATGQSPDNLDGLAPLFAGGKPATTEPVTTPTPTATTTVTTTPTPTAELPVSSGEPLPPVTEPQPSPIVTAPMAQQPEGGPTRSRKRLQLAGMIGGGSMVLIGFLLWGEAGTIQEEIDTHPTATQKQLEDLATLEKRGDSYAGWGNLLFLGGAVLGGVSTYYYIKGRKAHAASQSARIAPAVFDHGAGLTLTLGGSP